MERPDFGGLHHSNHFGQERILRSSGGDDRQRAGQIEGAGLQQKARRRVLRCAFAGDQGAIELGLPFDDAGVDRHALSRGQ